MYDEMNATTGGSTSVVEKPKSRAERIQDWKKENQAAYKEAQNACCVCTPTRAQMLLIDQYDGLETIPID
jgi:hypothetical protein